MMYRSSFSIRLWVCGLFYSAALFLSGCGLINGLQEPPEDEEPSENQPTNGENACGGDEELTFHGEPAERGDACGPCGRDSLQCDGDDEAGNTLICEPGGTLCWGPENVVATTDEVDEVVVSWEHVAGASEYYVYRDGDRIATVDAGEQEPGDAFAYVDEDAAPATPLAPHNFEVSQGEFTDGVELRWEFDPDTMIADGESHDYAVVAFHPGFDDGRSDPVTDSGHTVGTFDNEYQYRRADGEWVNFSGVFCMANECDLFVGLDDPQGPQLPQVEAGQVEAGDRRPGYHIPLMLEGSYIVPGSTDFELRALSATGAPGDEAEASGHIDVEDLYVQYQRAEQEDAADDGFEDIGEVQVEALVFDDSSQQYVPEGEITYRNLPHDYDSYYFRAVLWPQGFEELARITDDDEGRRGEPRVFSTAEDRTLQAIHPTGDEAWRQDFFDGVVFLATDPEGNIYFTDDEPNTAFFKDDFDGNKVWEFDEPSQVVNYVAASAQGYVYATSGSRVYRVESDDESEFDYWLDGEGRTARGVVADAEGYVYVALHGEDEYAIKKLEFPDELGDPVDEVWTVELEDQPTVVITGGDGFVYWGTMNGTVQRVSVDVPVPQEELDTIEIHPDSRGVLGLTFHPDSGLFACGYLTGVRGYFVRINFETESVTNVFDFHDLLNGVAVNQCAVDPEGSFYYATTSTALNRPEPNPLETRVVKFAGTHNVEWIYEEHADPNQLIDVRDIIVSPGFYGTFPDAWHDIMDSLEE